MTALFILIAVRSRNPIYKEGFHCVYFSNHLHIDMKSLKIVLRVGEGGVKLKYVDVHSASVENREDHFDFVC
jgi:hypothetical protein